MSVRSLFPVCWLHNSLHKKQPFPNKRTTQPFFFHFLLAPPPFPHPPSPFTASFSPLFPILHFSPSFLPFFFSFLAFVSRLTQDERRESLKRRSHLVSRVAPPFLAEALAKLSNILHMQCPTKPGEIAITSSETVRWTRKSIRDFEKSSCFESKWRCFLQSFIEEVLKMTLETNWLRV